MNILIKLTCLIGLVIAPILGGHAIGGAITRSEVIEVTNTMSNTMEVEMVSLDASDAKAIVTKSYTENGKMMKEEIVIEGTIEEVKAAIADLKNDYDL